jgi:predicted nicotinamide N-methyase
MKTLHRLVDLESRGRSWEDMQSSDYERLAALRAALESRYVLEEISVRAAEREWKLSSVRLDSLLSRHPDETETFPHGLLLWPAAFVLAEWLTAEPWLVAGRRVLEIGAGVGLPGLTARSLGAHVTQTDYQSCSLLLTEMNALQNGLTDIARFQADWRSLPDVGPFDVILGADVLYRRDLRPALSALFAKQLGRDGLVMLADRLPANIGYFTPRMEREGWECDIRMGKTTWEREEREIGVMFARSRQESRG